MTELIENTYSNSDSMEKEFLQQNIYKGIDPSNGLSITQLKLIVPDIYAYKIKIVGFETINDIGEIKFYSWEKYGGESYWDDWIFEPIHEIEEKQENIKVCLYLEFPGKVTRRFKEDFEG